MRKLIFTSFILLFLLTNNIFCQKQLKTEHYFLSVAGFYSVDTIKKVLYKNKNSNDTLFTICYSSSKNKCYKLSVKKPINHIKFVSERNFQLIKKEYKVYKFLYDDPNISDEEELYFYSPLLGIILTKNMSWGGYKKVFKINNPKKSQLSNLLGDQILQDCSFFDSWDK